MIIVLQSLNTTLLTPPMECGYSEKPKSSLKYYYFLFHEEILRHNKMPYILATQLQVRQDISISKLGLPPA